MMNHFVSMKPRFVLPRSKDVIDKGVVAVLIPRILMLFFCLTWRLRKTAAMVAALFFAGVTLFSITLMAATSQVVHDNFVLIRGSVYTMGTPEDEEGSRKVTPWNQPWINYSETQHQVRVSTFYMSKYAVTVAEFRKFVEATGYRTEAEKGGFSVIYSARGGEKVEGVNWRHGVLGKVRPQSEDNHPVLYVSWNDAVAYCQWMSRQTGKTYRLPTEAEREYACRAGSTTPFNTGQNLTTAQANYNGNFPYKNNPKGIFRMNTVPVDSFAPNAWGLYNMHGNVFEWCSDWYGGKYYDECKPAGTVINPLGPATGSYRVVRGGCWASDVKYCRSGDRDGINPSDRRNHVGFRVVYTP